ncbi:MAG: matrixin family metalloprotease [Proteobacteria bacterium]|nr:matrixin family metalloprotease [Pseudomonadota bacterium]
MKKTLIWALLFSLLLISACKSEDSAGKAKDYMPFTSNGYLYHWTKGPTVRIYLPLTSGVSQYSASFRNAFIAGISKWDLVLSKMGVSYDYTGTASDNDMKVEWDDGSGVSTGVLGFAEIDKGNDPSRRIVMTTQKNYSPFTSHTDAEITAITAHEFGHMLGIWSHSFDIADLMYPFAEGITDPSNRDQETMIYLYGITPDVDLSGLPANTALTKKHDNVSKTSHVIKAQCGPDPRDFNYPEFEHKVPEGVSPINSDLQK